MRNTSLKQIGKQIQKIRIDNNIRKKDLLGKFNTCTGIAIETGKNVRVDKIIEYLNLVAPKGYKITITENK